MLKLVVLFLVLHCLFAANQAALTDSQKAELAAHHKHCMEAVGVTQASLDQLKNGQFPDDMKLKEHLYCVSKRLGFQTESGEPQPGVMQLKIGAAVGDAGKAAALIKKCVVVKSTPQDTAYETFKCMYPDAKIILK